MTVADALNERAMNYVLKIDVNGEFTLVIPQTRCKLLKHLTREPSNESSIN